MAIASEGNARGPLVHVCDSIIRILPLKSNKIPCVFVIFRELLPTPSSVFLTPLVNLQLKSMVINEHCPQTYMYNYLQLLINVHMIA